MKLKYLSLFFILLLISFFPKESLAHTLESADAFGGVMHIDPNDEPVAGSQSTIIFDIKSKDEDFKLSDCVCNVHIIKDKKELDVLPLQVADPTSPNTGIATYTFATSGDYSLVLTGKPHPDENETFTLTYAVHVASQEKPQPASQSSTPYLLYIGLGILLILGAAIIVKKKIIH